MDNVMGFELEMKTENEVVKGVWETARNALTVHQITESTNSQIESHTGKEKKEKRN